MLKLHFPYFKANTKKSFVSCNPTVPFFLFFYKITRKTLISQLLTILFANRIFLRFCPQNPFWQNKIKKIIIKKADLLTLTFLGMWQETKLFFFKGLKHCLCHLPICVIFLSCEVDQHVRWEKTPDIRPWMYYLLLD